ncbi:MAG: o-succinylbenzoate synthase [Deltaproteobacteria bacterium]|jgi:O-succinylbenzoate synthase|nr:o-succinylbenzoate synthase [Deltaproteobacteria bacterium]
MDSFRWELFSYSLPLIEPLRMLGQELRERKGLILRLFDQAENCGEGEIAPFPGLHPESVSQAENEIKKFISTSFQQNPDSFNSLPASVRFGFEMAWRTLYQKFDVEEQVHFKAEDLVDSNKQHNQIKRRKIPVNGLATGSGDVLRQECEQLLGDGFKAVKLKVGRLKIQEDVKRVELAKKIFGDQISLRIDANRSWSWKQAVEFAQSVRDCRIEYCEEPLRDIQLLEKLHEQTGMPLALDETLWKIPDPKQLPKSGISTLILKPGILGGWKNTGFWTRYAKKNKIHVVLSSCIESGLGLNWLAFTASKLLTVQIPAGLDTAKLLQNDLIDPPFTIVQGNYVLPDSRPEANMNYLQKISEGYCTS